MRNLVLALLLLNLGFFAYAAWIDQPSGSAAQEAPVLPKLLLASEFAQAARGAGDSSAPTGSASLRAQAAPAAPNVAVGGAGSSAPPAPAAAISELSPSSLTGPDACVAVGPFNDPALAARASSVLQDLGLAPRERRARGDVTDGFWVHVENIATAGDQARVMRSLLQAGLSDASTIQSADQTRHISVGIFSDRSRAERRAKSVQRLGIDAQVSPRTHPGTLYWLEMAPKGSQPSVPIEGVPATEGVPLEVRACSAIPVGAASAQR